MRMSRMPILLSLAVLLTIPTVTSAQAPTPLTQVLDALEMRNIGPFRTSAWITEIAVPETPLHDHLYTIYAASRSGGLWKTVNNGITWDNVSDSIDVGAVGAVELSPSNPGQVWLGTGANDLARSSYSGKGLFKSTDGGATWSAPMLTDSHHINRIVVHPTDPDTVWVAVMGHLFSRNQERGVFRTRDGAADLVIDRDDPDTLYAAMYEKHRMPWQLVLGGPGSGIYKTTDGGTTWRRLEGGLPDGDIGRIGLDFNQAAGVLHAVVENVNPRPAGWPARHDACSPTREIGTDTVGNEVYRSDDDGATWSKTHGNDVDVAGSKAPYSFNQMLTDPSDPDHIIIISDSMYESRDGGASWSCGFFRGVFGDFRTLWWDDQDPQRIMIGSDGGVNVSYDGGRTAKYFVNLPIGEVYAVGVDMDDPYNVYGGLQDHDSWKGPSNAPSGMITLEDWTTVGTGDGMYNQVDPTDSRWVYNTLQAGGQARFDQLTGQATRIAPPTPPGFERLIYNWTTPIMLSPHNPQIVYTGAQLLFRSLDRGDSWENMSPDLTTADPERCGLGSGYVPYCSITTISESPVTPGVIWIGTDDGKVQLSRDHGATWTDLTAILDAAGGPADRWTTRVFASPHAAGTAFVSKNGFRNDDFAPYLFVTTDYGATWRSIDEGLPEAPINVVVQDPDNENLLLVGNDLGVWASIDAGASWARLRANLPTVPVHDLTIHPRESDLVLGTYGRGIWVGDIAPLRQLSNDVLAQSFHLFDVTPRPYYGFRALGNFHLFGNAWIEVPNEPDGLEIYYWLGQAANGGASITVSNIRGEQIATLEGPADAGLNFARWNMRPGSGSRRGGRGGFGGRGGGGALLPPGDYRITVSVGGQEQSTVGTIRERIR
ncbi:MAG: hypothetical protein PVJ51_13665 [Acidobacteriota bacterium]|jgi:hypothetical protein